MKMSILIALVLAATGISCEPSENEVSPDEIAPVEVLEVFEKFQEGYTRRDPAFIDDFMELFTKDIVMVGTASQEFFSGLRQVKKLALGDWESWYDLNIPMDDLDIRIEGDVAWFAVSGSSGPWEDNRTYEIRMVGTLVKTDGKLLFKQVSFSYPFPLKAVS